MKRCLILIMCCLTAPVICPVTGAAAQSVAQSAGESTRVSLDQFPMEAAPPHYCLKVAETGKIYFADRGNYKIRVFSPTGQYLSSIGGSGQGPGEFQRWFGQFALTPDGDIFQVDFFGGNRRITHFAAHGRLIDSVPIKDPTANGAAEILALNNGKVALSIFKSPSVERKNPFLVMNMTIEFTVADSAGKPGPVLAKAKFPVSFSGLDDSGWPNIPFAPEFLTAYCPKTNTAVCLLTNSPRITVFHFPPSCSPKKKTIKKTIRVDLGSSLQPVTRADIKTWIEEKKENPRVYRMHEHIYKLLLTHWQKIVPAKPAVHRIFFNPEGEFFIVSENDKKFTVRKLSPGFKPLRVETMDAVPAFIGKKRLYYLKYDDENDHNYIEIIKRGRFF